MSRKGPEVIIVWVYELTGLILSYFPPSLSANKALPLTLESFPQKPTSLFFKLHAN